MEEAIAVFSRGRGELSGGEAVGGSEIGFQKIDGGDGGGERDL